jgi:hypothetical protein
MLSTFLAVMIALAAPHGHAPHAQVTACETSIVAAINNGAPLTMHGAIRHDCGRRAGLSHHQREQVARYVENYVSKTAS